MDLLILDNITDFVAIKKGCCMSCTEKKLNCKILRIMNFEGNTFMQWKKEIDIKGVNIKCECGDFTPMNYKR